MPTLRLTALLAAVLLVLATEARAADASPGIRDLSSIRSAGMGDATRAFASSGEALHVNPAGIAATTRFNIETYGLAEPGADLYVFGASAIDSKINSEEAFSLSGGFGYTYYSSGSNAAETKRQGSILSLGLALPLVPEDLFIGATVRYMRLTGAVVSNAATMDLGVILRPTPFLSVAGVIQNLIDVRSPEATRFYAFGLALGSEVDFHLAFDTRIDFNAEGKAVPIFQVGGEYVLQRMFVPRAGFVEDRLRNARYLTAGFTAILSGYAVDLMYRYDVKKGDIDVDGNNFGGFGIALRLLESPF